MCLWQRGNPTSIFEARCASLTMPMTSRSGLAYSQQCGRFLRTMGENLLRPDSVRLIGQMILSRTTSVQDFAGIEGLRVPVLALLQGCENSESRQERAETLFGAAIRHSDEPYCLLGALMALVSKVTMGALTAADYAPRLSRKF